MCFEESISTKLNHFNSFVENLCGDVLSIEETAHDLFNPREEINEDDVNKIIRVSTNTYTDKHGESI